MKTLLTSLLYSLVSAMPSGIRDRIYDRFFLLIPLRLLSLFSCAYAGYFAKGRPQSGDIVVDAGAFEGTCTVLLSRLVGSRGKVLCFEPDAAAAVLIERRMKRLGLNNYEVIRKGLWNYTGRLQFFIDPASSMSSCFHEYPSMTPVTIDCITLDEAVEQFHIGRVDFIKMDIEGAEIEAIEGARRTIERFSPFWAIASYHIRSGEQTSKRIEHELGRLGYTTITAYPPHLTTYAWKVGLLP